jgi:hypothetical protein
MILEASVSLLKPTNNPNLEIKIPKVKAEQLGFNLTNPISHKKVIEPHILYTDDIDFIINQTPILLNKENEKTIKQNYSLYEPRNTKKLKKIISETFNVKDIDINPDYELEVLESDMKADSFSTLPWYELKSILNILLKPADNPINNDLIILGVDSNSETDFLGSISNVSKQLLNKEEYQIINEYKKISPSQNNFLLEQTVSKKIILKKDQNFLLKNPKNPLKLDTEYKKYVTDLLAFSEDYDNTLTNIFNFLNSKSNMSVQDSRLLRIYLTSIEQDNDIDFEVSEETIENNIKEINFERLYRQRIRSNSVIKIKDIPEIHIESMPDEDSFSINEITLNKVLDFNMLEDLKQEILEYVWEDMSFKDTKIKDIIDDKFTDSSYPNEEEEIDYDTQTQINLKKILARKDIKNNPNPKPAQLAETPMNWTKIGREGIPTYKRTAAQSIQSTGPDFMSNQFDAYLLFDPLGEEDNKIADIREFDSTPLQDKILSSEGFAVRFASISVKMPVNDKVDIAFLGRQVPMIKSTNNFQKKASFSFDLDENLWWLTRFQRLSGHIVDQTTSMRDGTNPLIQGFSQGGHKRFDSFNSNPGLLLRTITTTWPKKNYNSMGICLVIKCTRVSEWYNEVNQVMELPWFVFEDIKFLGTDSIKYDRNSPDATRSINVDFTFRRMTKTRSIMSKYYWKANDAVDSTGSLKELTDLKRMIPVALDLSNKDEDGVRWVDIVGPKLKMEEDLEKLKEYLTTYENKKNYFTTIGGKDSIQKINTEIAEYEKELRESYGSFYPILRSYK